MKRLFMFSELLAKIKTETKIKTSLRARGPPGVSGALRSVRILRIGRISSGWGSTKTGSTPGLENRAPLRLETGA